jgi:hypothetical protein
MYYSPFKFIKHLLLTGCVIVFTGRDVFSQGIKINFISIKNKNPVSEVSKYLGKRILVFGSVRNVKSDADKRIIIIGRMGALEHPPKYTTNLKVIIFKNDLYKFRNLKDFDLYKSIANISGKVIYYHKELALQLKNPKDVNFVVTRDGPTVK